MSQQAEELIEHHGVKGMKWGVRNDKGHEGERAKTKVIEKADKKFEKVSIDTFINIHNSAAQKSNDLDIDRINNKPEYKKAADRGDLLHDTPIKRKYENEHRAAFSKRLLDAANEQGTNASGTRKYNIVGDSYGDWKVVPVDVKHSTEDSFTVKVKRDAKGQIVSLSIAKPLTHSLEDFFEHYGVRGMQWGVRKRSAKDERARAQRFKTKDNRRTLSDSDLDSYISRLEKEKKLKNLIDEDLQPGRTIAKRVLTESGQKAAKTTLTGAGLLLVKTAVTQRFDPVDAAGYLAPKPKK